MFEYPFAPGVGAAPVELGVVTWCHHRVAAVAVLLRRVSPQGIYCSGRPKQQNRIGQMLTSDLYMAREKYYIYINDKCVQKQIINGPPNNTCLFSGP